MEISVLPCEWGDAKPEDIQVLLRDVASHIERELRDSFPGTIEVMNLPGQTPQTYYRSSNDGAYPINLTAKGGLWSQFAYQFAHEYCHVLSGYERFRLIRRPNSWWFHESMAELASMFVLRQMGKRWQNHENRSWARFAPSHAKYADNLLKGHASNTPSGSFRAWLSENEVDLGLTRTCATRMGWWHPKCWATSSENQAAGTRSDCYRQQTATSKITSSHGGVPSMRKIAGSLTG